MKKEIEREPDVPALNNEAINLLSDLVFREDNVAQKVDLIFIFGFTKGIDDMVPVVKSLISLNLSSKVFITGGVVVNAKQPESEFILEGIGPENYPNTNFVLETKSTNTLENVTEALKVLDFSDYKKILFLSKRYASGRGYLTLKKFLPNTELLQMSWSPNNYGEGDIEITKNNWLKHDVSKRRVWGAFLRIKKYGERGDIYFDDEVKSVVDKITSLTSET
ncbi:hypothetical protein COB55_02195 [Candidatus Wolfebacteria bacterium]|nr:MAG: hypothetical protein COB55_02195 [Candidatus Wolfebacteria bacterium]